MGITGSNAGKSIVELFEEQAQRHLYRAAAVEGTHVITYGDLHTQSNAVAGYLLWRMNKRPAIVAVCFKPIASLLAVVLGVLKAGSACVFVEPAQPIDRSLFIIRESKVDHIITHGGTGDMIRPFIDSEIIDAETMMRSPLQPNFVSTFEMVANPIAFISYVFDGPVVRRITLEHQRFFDQIKEPLSTGDRMDWSIYLQLKHILTGGKII